MSLYQQIIQARDCLSKKIIGQEALVNKLFIALLADGHLLVEGAPGLAKTRAIKELGYLIEADFHRVQFTPDLLPADLTGTEIYRPQDGSFHFQQGPLFHNLLLADEINRAPAKVQSALLEAMAEKQITVGRETYQLPKLFMVMATQNPIEQEGTYPLPEAQLDRFLFKILIDYPKGNEELQLVQHITDNKLADKLDVSKVKSCITADIVMQLQQQAAALQIDEKVVQYAIDIVRATRSWPGISMGAGPRGGIALVRAARAYAIVKGRDFIIPDDIKNVTLPAMRHRIVLSPEMELEGTHIDRVLETILDKVEAPRS